MGTYTSLVHKQIFDEGVQDELREKTSLYTALADVRTENGEFIYARKGSDVVAQNTVDGSYSASTFSYDKDSIGIPYQAVYSERLDLMEVTKQGFLIKEDRIDRHAFALARKINREFITAHVLATGTQVLDNEVLAGSASALTPITLSTSNPDDVSATATQLLQEANALDDMPYMIMRPKDAKNFGLYAMGTGNNLMDRVIAGGTQMVKTMFGFDVLVTNDVPYRQVGTAAANWTAADTVTIAGVVFTFVATPSAAGDVDLGASAAISLTNLATAVNNTFGYAAGVGTATTYIEVSAANRLILNTRNISATADATTITVTGNGRISATESGAQFSWGTERALIIAAGRKSAVLRLPERGFESKEKEVPLFTGTELVSTRIHGSGVWSKNAPKIIVTHVAV